MADKGRGVEAAGAVADDDLGPARGEQAAEDADDEDEFEEDDADE